MKRVKRRKVCGINRAANRLGISVDEVLHLILRGELSAVMRMEDGRWLVDVDAVESMARESRRRDGRPWERAWRRAASPLRRNGHRRERVLEQHQ